MSAKRRGKTIDLNENLEKVDNETRLEELGEPNEETNSEIGESEEGEEEEEDTEDNTEDEKDDEEERQVYSLHRGPLRPYVHIHEEEVQSWRRINPQQKLHLISAVIFAISLRVINTSIPDKLTLNEYDIVSHINNYLTGEFFIDLNPPFASLLFTVIANIAGYSSGNLDKVSIGYKYSNFPYHQIRAFNAILSGITVFFGYIAMRATGVSHMISMFGVFMLTFENSLITESKLILPQTIFIFFFALLLAQHKSAGVSKLLSRKWVTHIVVAAFALGMCVSTHWIGLFVWVYAIVSIVYRLCYLSGDLTIKSRDIRLSTTLRIVLFLAFPIAIYLSLYKIHFDTLMSKGPAYNSLSPEFQYSLNGNHLKDAVSEVPFGSTIMIRHYKTREYLHSHDDVYGSSNHQQVTLLQSFDDVANFFEILPIKDDDGKLVESKASIHFPWKVQLRHTLTDSKLVIDPNNKPPLSEQEYNSQVTTDKNFYESDEERYTFSLKISEKYSKTDDAKRSLKLVESVFQIHNEKNGCYLLGTPLVLDEGFAEGQKEVICIKEPNYEASLWYIDWNTNSRFTGTEPTISLKEYNFWDKFLEVHLLKFQKLFIGDGGYKVTIPKSLGDWMLLRKGYTYFIDSENHNTIYLLGNYITYQLIVLSISIYIIYKVYQFATFNPYAVKDSLDVALYNYDYQSLDFIISFGLLYVTIKLVKIDLHLYDYTAMMIPGTLLITQLVQLGIKKAPKSTTILIIVSSVLILLAYKKFSPIIYGFNWSRDACYKMMVGPGWDRNICNVYEAGQE
ncbi:hypothetical protein CANINC_002531 [Pichia inconspicua]|uniref:Dolichyl-phosphate-mannose--protein mannosyltransferase n=1 Tax=Pichia inconspicua TaxID=52247 RepID=A0A4T0X1D1_9ASCO|nr:hypothetical protein CANINC_002531 [[Candida] inconspicua]